jgi:hypothetical protein
VDLSAAHVMPTLSVGKILVNMAARQIGKEVTANIVFI